MATLLSAKDILLSYDVFAVKDLEGRVVKRGTAHEFQDYAYRLASDLNDLEHLRIYMKLAKTIPRYILDRTYEFVADATTDQKSKLFMWKLKQVRADLQMQKNLQLFDYDLVYKKTKQVRENLADVILKKNDEFESNFLAKILLENNVVDLKKIEKVLFIGNDCSLIPAAFIPKAKKVIGIDSSKNLTTKLKQIFKDSKNAKFMTKDFLKNSFKDLYFDVVVLSKYWQCIPLEAELKFLKGIKRVLKSNGQIILGINCGEKEIQKWSVKNSKGDELMIYEKTNEKSKLEELFKTIGLKITNTFAKDRLVYYVLE